MLRPSADRDDSGVDPAIGVDLSHDSDDAADVFDDGADTVLDAGPFLRGLLSDSTTHHVGSVFSDLTVRGQTERVTIELEQVSDDLNHGTAIVPSNDRAVKIFSVLTEFARTLKGICIGAEAEVERDIQA